MSPWKTFSAGEVLTAANLQSYAVDQSTLYFASSADRTTALPAPTQGMISFLNDTGTLWQWFGTYNSGTNPGGALTAGWYPMPGCGLFAATATKSTATSTTETLGSAGFAYTEITDTLNWHNAVTNPDRITPTIAGLYRVTPTIQWTASGSGTSRRLSFSKTGTLYFEQRVGTGTGVNNNASVVLSMNGSTDYITVTCFQDTGSALSATGQVTVEYLRPTTA